MAEFNDERDRLEMRLVVIERDIESMRRNGTPKRSDPNFERYTRLVADRDYIKQELGYP